jgi:hypothetical protein
VTHEEAVQEWTADRYLLGELTVEDREAFELHYFECPHCAAALRLDAAFHHGACQALSSREFSEAWEATPGKVVAEQGSTANMPGWKRLPGWLMPWTWEWSWQAGYALAGVMLAVVLYQSLVRIPELEHRAALALAPQPLYTAVLRAETRGEEQTVQLPEDESWLLLVLDVNDPRPSPRYRVALTRNDGTPIFTRLINTPPPGDSWRLLLPASNISSDSYTLAVYPEQGDIRQADAIGFYRFAVQRP